MEKIILPGIIAKSKEELRKKIERVKRFTSWVHLDVVDGEFAKNHSLDFDFTLPQQDFQTEAHLMVKNPELWITKHGKKISILIVHFESVSSLPLIIRFMQEKQCKIGIAIEPETSVDVLKKYLELIDQVTIMTVHPGFYGSPFIPEQLEKVKTLRKLKPSLDIEVDGGMNPETIKLALKAGANKFVSGSYLLEDSEDVKTAFNALRESINETY